MKNLLELPKVTRGMRFNTDLDINRNLKNSSEEKRNILLLRAKEVKNVVTWKELKLFVAQNEDNPELSQLLHELWKGAKNLVGTEENGKIIDDAAIYLLTLFLDANVVMMKHLSQLKKMFGPIANSVVNKICSIVKDISALLSEDARKFIVTSASQESKVKKKFEVNVSLSIPGSSSMFDDSITKLHDLSAKATVAAIEISKFSMKYDASIKQESSTANQSKKPDKFSRAWLAEDVAPDLVIPLVELLKSPKTSDELQNELFDFLGFDKFEIIQKVLKNRKAIIARITEDDKKSAIKEKVLTKKLTESLTGVLPPPPPVGCQIFVNSENEKIQIKQARKEEKKLKNLLKDNDLENENVEILPSKLKTQQLNSFYQTVLRENNNINTTTERLLKPSIRRTVKYPYVFDSQAEAKAHVGYIAGSKMVLSSDVTRNDTRMYEEVIIPASEKAPLEVGNKPIQISTLDEIGQIAFQGTKQLNRIQTVVYPVAYHTNENLLICAPTGAGKTNVAMLTIVNCIRQNIDQGVINRDQFKIVYIAPMKALAAEMTENFGRKLKPLDIKVRELTGDMQLTKREMQETQMLVTTPEKWDVVTRKGAGDVSIINLVKLLIIDEVHLLHGERGPVVEAVVARTLRFVESSQSMIRIVGLSATLPNYIDVARFLRVNPMNGLFFFDSRFRPIPLEQVFIGVKSIKPLQQMADMDVICYDKIIEMLKQGHQIMVFVHARNATVRTATVLRETAQQKKQLSLFMPENTSDYGMAQKVISRSRNKQLVELFNCGLAMHHAGMLRADRNLVEKYFSEGYIKVLVCTSTLAWGVNLPAHAVIIKGTEIYDSKHGSFIDLGILDVLQIFGRAGRPQFDKSGVGTIITSHDKLNHYLSLLTNQFPIESNFINCLSDNLNAEITLGTITNIDEAIEWLSYTYLFVRMKLNPLVYGINYDEVMHDPNLDFKRRELIKAAATSLDKARMCRFNERTGDMNVTDLGRTASHFYVKYDTVEIFNEMLRPVMTEGEIIAMMSNAQEFQQLKVRDDEMDELDEITKNYCEVPVKGGSENIQGKVNILMQTYLSRGFVKSFSLMSDMSYITQNVVRIARALFTIVLRSNNALLAGRLLNMSKMFEKQLWDFETPLRQFTIIPADVIEKIENRGLSIHTIREMEVKEISDLVRNQKYGSLVKKCSEEFPLIDIDASLQPITRTVLRIRIFITANFKWNDRVHGKTAESFWIWIEDPESNFIYHSEHFQLSRKHVITAESQEVVMTIPLKDPLPPQYYIRATSDLWLGSTSCIPLSFKHLILPELHPPHTELLPLQPLPVTVLKNEKYQSLYKFSHFNPIQTQIFHCLYHTDNNVLLGAPTGSGKTIAAELAIFRVFNTYPKMKVVYIAPMKALVRERMEDWKVRFEKKLGKKVVELTGDVTPDIRAIRESTVIVTTPEKWDGISRSWQTRDYVRDVALIVIDEIHLLGEDRGPVLEVIVSRTNYISSHTSQKLRIIGLSTALANARDLANWLGIEQMGLYNFKPSVRPVPLSVHISGYPGKHYCPRMATMNRPAYQAIRQYSPCTPALIFVSSRRQTRLTALDLISFLAGEDNPKQFLHIAEPEMDQILMNIKDTNLKLTLAFGIGLHHAGLQERDRKTCEELFLNRKIQVLVATATLAWGVNLPVHLVIVKGTEYYDGKIKRYVDMPVTDVLQMMGRAGRPQFDNEGIAVVLVHDVKKNFYKKFLYDPFPVESSLLNVLPDHINAEIVGGTIKSTKGVLDYLTWTYFFRRLLRNPTYYDLEEIQPEQVNNFLTNLVSNVLNVLVQAGCVHCDDDGVTLHPTSMGRISSFYYLSHQSMRHFADSLQHEMKFEEILKVMCDAYEFDQHPVRHNEDGYNANLAQLCRLKVDPLTYDSPHTKTFLLMQAHFSHLPLPNTDYLTDTKSVLDQAIRILQAMIDICAERGWLATTIQIQQLMQCTIQARWTDDPDVLCLPNVEEFHVPVFEQIKTACRMLTLPAIKEACYKNYELLAKPLRAEFSEPEIEQIHKVLCDMPTINVELSVCGNFGEQLDITRPIVQPPNTRTWIELYAAQEYTLNLNLHRLGVRQSNNKIYCPKFPKEKDEAWFYTLGCQANGELIAMKRINYRSSKSSHQLSFVTPNKKGRIIYTVYLISDGLIGFDQQYNVQIDVINSIGEIRDNYDEHDSYHKLKEI